MLTAAGGTTVGVESTPFTFEPDSYRHRRRRFNTTSPTLGNECQPTSSSTTMGFTEFPMSFSAPLHPLQLPRVEPRPPLKVRSPFVAAQHRPSAGECDGKFRVVLMSTDSPASVNMPSIVGTLCKVSPSPLPISADARTPQSTSRSWPPWRACDTTTKRRWTAPSAAPGTSPSPPRVRRKANRRAPTGAFGDGQIWMRRRAGPNRGTCSCTPS